MPTNGPLPDGRISGQITRNRPQKKIRGYRKLVAVRPPNWKKRGRKEAEKFSLKTIAVNVYFTSEKHEEKGSHSWSI